MRIKVKLAGKGIVTRVLEISGDMKPEQLQLRLELEVVNTVGSGGNLIINLNKIEAPSDDALSILSRWHGTFENRGGQLVIVCANQRVIWSLENFPCAFTIVSNVDDAIRIIRKDRCEATV